MALLGTEILFVTGVSSGGVPGASPQQTTTGAVAATALLNRGTFSASGTASVVVNATSVDANSNLIFTLKSALGTVGAYPTISAITASTGFTIVATAGDNSTYNYMVLG